MKQPINLLPGAFSQTDVDKLKTQASEVVDIYEIQLHELREMLFPNTTKAPSIEEFTREKGNGKLAGAWSFFPWSGQLLHCVGPEELFALRTNRNKLLITEREQQILRESVVGIAGMSVGAGMATALAYSGMSQSIKIADFDTLDTTNLNRLREPLSSVGKSKVELAAQRIYELDPFSVVDIFDKGVKETDLDRFFTQPKLDIVIDEIDDFKTKINLRKMAKKCQIPLLMFTSLGDNILIDVERYDIDSDLVIFNNLLGTLTYEILNNENITPDDEKKYAVQLVGQEYVPTRALESLLEMGKTLVGRPQLYSTIAVDGGLCAYIVRKILLGEKIVSGRYFVKFADLINLKTDELAETSERNSILKTLMSPKK